MTTKSDWIDRFARTLMRLQPTMNAVAAGTNALDAYPDAMDVEPEVAAQTWVEECGPDDCRST
jgi:hypothetical protein